MNDAVLRLLGLARKAGRLEAGEEPAGAACRSGKARLLLVASDAAPNTFRRAAHFGQAGKVLWLTLPHTKEEAGRLLGRKSCALLAVTDFGLAAAVGRQLARLDPERCGPAAAQLQERADRALERQREKRRHEKNLQKGKKKPWAAPPKESPRPPGDRAAQGARSSKGAERPRAGAGRSGPAASPSGRSGSGPRTPTRSGPGGKKLTAKPLAPGRRPLGPKP